MITHQPWNGGWVPSTPSAIPNTNMALPAYPTMPTTYPTISASYAGTIGQNFEPVEAGRNGSHVILVVDESGSMGHLRDSTISAVNEFISGQRQDAINNKIDTFASVFTFDGYNVKKIIDKANVLATPTINRDNYNPTGMTNLNDAFGSVIASTNEELKTLSNEIRPSVIITIMTDGQENASKTFSLNDVNTMMGKCKDKKWAFMFLGANIDAFAVGQSYGFSKTNSMNYAASAAGVSQTLSAATRMTNSVKYARSVDATASMESVYDSVGFTDDERNKSMGSE